MRILWFAVMFGMSSSAIAQDIPASDPRIAVMIYGDESMVSLATSTQTGQTLLMPPGEQIVSVMLSDLAAYQIVVATSQDSLSLRALGPRSLAVMTVKTGRRDYNFQLMPEPGGQVPVVYRLIAGQENAASVFSDVIETVPESERRVWEIKGDKAVQPAKVTDDGERTYIEWAADQAMPATFAEGTSGNEETVNGNVRFGVYTVDRVFDRLVFRIDDARATAEPGRDRRQGRERN